MTPEEPPKPPMLAGFNVLELAAGAVVVIIGLIVSAESMTYPMGSLRNVGAGIFPMLLGFVMSALGLAIILEGRVSLAVAPKVPWRAMFAICAALGAFALLIDRAGAYAAIFALIFLSGLADKTFRPLTLLIVALSLCGFVTALVFGFRGMVNMDLLPGG